MEAGCYVEVVELRKPPGKKAYVMNFKIDEHIPEIYVGVELGAGIILGRSFRYSDRNKNIGEEYE